MQNVWLFWLELFISISKFRLMQHFLQFPCTLSSLTHVASKMILLSNIDVVAIIEVFMSTYKLPPPLVVFDYSHKIFWECSLWQNEDQNQSEPKPWRHLEHQSPQSENGALWLSSIHFKQLMTHLRNWHLEPLILTSV